MLAIDLTGKRALIAGVSDDGGFGFAIAKALAEAGQGSFYHASFGGDHLQKIVDDIGRLEKTQFESEIATQYDERFQIFVLMGIAIALIELFMGDRRRASRLWKGRFEVVEEKMG